MAMLKVPVSQDDHVQGDENALYTLVEYGDYECPFCGQAYPIVKRVQQHFGKQLRFVFRNFPLTEIHPEAAIAAEAAEFAATKGNFWKMHDLIYENQNHLSLETLLELGEELQLPRSKLEKAIKERAFETKIKKDFLSGVRSGVNGTPTFFINDYRYNGSFDYDDLVTAIESIYVK
jgi:protein-disulfide isomerase